MNTTEHLSLLSTSPLFFTSLQFWGLATVGGLLTGISKSGFAGGAAVIAVPLLSLLIPVPVAAALIGIISGGFLLGELPSSLLQLLLGLFCIVFSVWKKLTPLLGRLPYAGFIWGAVSGLTSTLLHSGGPPINIYLATRQLPKHNWLANAAVFFAMMNLIQIIPYSLTGQWQFNLSASSLSLPSLLLIDIILLPVSLIGVWLGYRLHAKISEAHFMSACKGLLFLSGLGLLISAVI